MRVTHKNNVMPLRMSKTRSSLYAQQIHNAKHYVLDIVYHASQCSITSPSKIKNNQSRVSAQSAQDNSHMFFENRIVGPRNIYGWISLAGIASAITFVIKVTLVRISAQSAKANSQMFLEHRIKWTKEHLRLDFARRYSVSDYIY